MIRINCQHNDRGAWCKHKKIKRSLFGIGARCCIEFSYPKEKCKYHKPFVRPAPPFPQQPKPPLLRVRAEDGGCGTCLDCGSSLKYEKIFSLKKVCINPECSYGKGNHGNIIQNG